MNLQVIYLVEPLLLDLDARVDALPRLLRECLGALPPERLPVSHHLFHRLAHLPEQNQVYIQQQQFR